MPIILSIRNMLIRANRFRNSRNHYRHHHRLHHHQNDNIHRGTSISNDDDTKDDHNGYNDNDSTDGDCKNTYGRRIVKTVRRFFLSYPTSFMWWSVMLPIAIGLIYQHYIDSNNIHTTVSTSTTTTAKITPSR